MLNGRQPVSMPRMKRDIESVIRYPASRIHTANSIPNAQCTQIERNVLGENGKIFWIIFILNVIPKLKQGSIVDMKSIGFSVANVEHKKEEGRSPPQSLGTA